MTRFARAKGSKASNERVPEDATPWSEMKQQLLSKKKELEESKNKQAAINQRNANYKAFLDEKEEEERKNTQWAEFPGENKPDKRKSNQKKSFKDEVNDDDDDEAFIALKNKVDKVLEKVNNESLENGEDEESDSPPEVQSSKIEHTEPVVKTKKAKKKKLSIVVDEVVDPDNSKDESDSKKRKLSNTDIKKSKKTKKNVDKNKKGIVPKKVIKENLSELDLKKIEKKKQKRIKQMEKKKKFKEESKQQKQEQLKNGENEVNMTEDNEKPQPKPKQKNLSNNKFEKNGAFNKNNKLNKFKDSKEKNKKGDKEHARKKPFLPTKMMINGKEVEVDYVDGFPVKKEDAVRLKKLRKEMINKGLPRSEINIALKLERRKAEKAFAREKKKVCFNCRKSGHNLSECPDLDKNQIASQSGSGICFKCGSTEHTHFECKVVRTQEFKYASCFICNEQGHIARQCPDNARGLYPKGGSCRVCGDVTHLKKDCPKYQAEQQQIQNSLSVGTLSNSNPDNLDDKQFNVNNVANKRQNKIIKF